MATSRLAGILWYLRGVGGPSRGDEPSDAQLLERFVVCRDEGAFAALLGRHGPLVLGVCRQVLQDDHDAEDAFQATFLVLARRAASIRRHEALAAWLHRVAVNIARTARTSAALRRTHERQAGAMAKAHDGGDPALSDWQAVLHEEVNRLPEKYRAPVVLCYLGGKTNEEAAHELGWPVGTVKGRLGRARTLLRRRLSGRGLALPAGGVAAVLTSSAVRAAVPPTLARATLQAALRFAAGQTAAPGVSASAAFLAEQALRTNALLKWGLLALFALAAGIAGGAALVVYRVHGETASGERAAVEAETPPRPAPAQQVNGPEPVPVLEQRIVFAGDSSTDGNTYLMLVRQGLARAGRPVPACINAGVSTDTARGIRQRLERDVFVHRPTLVAFSAGTHDAIYNVAPADYEADVRAIAAELRRQGVPMLLLTTGLLSGEFARFEPRLTEYNAVLHRLGREFGCRVADVNRRMQEARAAGLVVIEGDNVSPNQEGHRLIARAVLDALGHADVPVPRELEVGLLPGVLTEWRVRIAPGQAPLTDHLVRALEPDGAGWTTWSLPEKGPERTWWREQERKRGFVLSLARGLGEAKVYQGVAWLEADRAKPAFLHTGGHLVSVWLNGERIYKAGGWTGWHAGKECLPVQLRRGRNVIVIESGAEFFLSIAAQRMTGDR
jgi:RNA polymerase sigma factor (sigma-70 family)